MVLFARQEDPSKDPKSHLLRREVNRKYDLVGALERTAASEGVYKSIHGPSGLNLLMSAAVVKRADGMLEGAEAKRREYVTAGGALARVMQETGSSSAQMSGASTRASPERPPRPRARSALPHAGEKLNDALSRAWIDRQDSLRQSKAADAVKQLLAEAKEVDSASTTAIAEAERTIRSHRSSKRSKSTVRDDPPGKDARVVRAEGAGDKSGVRAPATAQAAPDEASPVMATAHEEKRTRAWSARLSMSLNKSKDLEGKARVWDMSGGLHVAGARRGETPRTPASPLHGRVARRESSAARAWPAVTAMQPTRGQQAKPGCPRVGRRESSAAHAWAAEKARLPTRGLQRKPCCPRTRAAWLRGSQSSEATVFLEFHFRGFDVLLGAGRQSEVVSVLGFSGPWPACSCRAHPSLPPSDQTHLWRRCACRFAITLPRNQDQAPRPACPLLQHHASSVCSSRSQTTLSSAFSLLATVRAPPKVSDQTVHKREFEAGDLIFALCSAGVAVQDGPIQRAAADREQRVYIEISVGRPGDLASSRRDA